MAEDDETKATQQQESPTATGSPHHDWNALCPMVGEFYLGASLALLLALRPIINP